MTIVVAGGTGFIGRRLVERLAAAGHDVAVLTRRPRGARDVAWDGPWKERVARADAVVNLCGENVAGGRWTAARKAALASSRLETTRALAGALGQAKVFVNASAVGYYGVEGGPADESAPRGAGFLAELCEQWEAGARLAEGRGARVVLARFGVVLGRGGGALEKMLPPFRLGLGGRLGSGRQAFPWVHVEDAAGLVEAALADARYRGPVNAVAPQALDNAAFTAALGRALRRPTAFPVPAFVLKVALGEMSEMLLEGRVVVPGVARANGYRFKFADVDSALRDLLIEGDHERAP